MRELLSYYKYGKWQFFFSFSIYWFLIFYVRLCTFIFDFFYKKISFFHSIKYFKLSPLKLILTKKSGIFFIIYFNYSKKSILLITWNFIKYFRNNRFLLIKNTFYHRICSFKVPNWVFITFPFKKFSKVIKKNQFFRVNN